MSGNIKPSNESIGKEVSISPSDHFLGFPTLTGMDNQKVQEKNWASNEEIMRESKSQIILQPSTPR
jgi:hypothetical protein